MFVNPVPGGCLSSHQGLGPRRRNWHHGVDISAPVGTPVSNILEGDVFCVGFRGEYGNTVVVRCGTEEDPVYFVYAHLDTIGVVEGDHVFQGVVLGTVGSTTSLTGSDGRPRSETMAPHLHLEITKGWPLGRTDRTSRYDVLHELGKGGVVVFRGGLMSATGEPVEVYGPWLGDVAKTTIKGYDVVGERITGGLGSIIVAFVLAVGAAALIAFGGRSRRPYDWDD